MTPSSRLCFGLFSVALALALLTDARDSRATPARTDALGADTAFLDDTDVFVFPSSMSFFPNSLLADLSTFGFFGSGGILYPTARHGIGLGLFVNRDRIGTSFLGRSDDITESSNRISTPRRVTFIESSSGGIITNTRSFDSLGGVGLPTPEKILDLVVALPDYSLKMTPGLGLSLSHKSEPESLVPQTVTDEAGLPQSISLLQNRRSTLLSIIPSLTFRTESGTLETSAEITLSNFKVENRIGTPVPENVPTEEFQDAVGIVVRQAGPPSVETNLRWRTRRSPTTEWVVYNRLARRDYDSINRIEDKELESNRWIGDISAGPLWDVASSTKFGLLGQFGVNRLTVSGTSSEERRQTTIRFPGMSAGVESKIGKYVSIRGGLDFAYQLTTHREPPLAEGANPRRFRETSSTFGWSVGVSGHIQRLRIDTAVEPALITQGPSFLGGDLGGGQGTGLFSLISLTYDFSKSLNHPAHAADPPVDPTGSN